MFGQVCPAPAPSPVSACSTFDFSAVFDCAVLPFTTPTPTPTPVPFFLRFSGTSGVTIPSNDVASIYPITINVNGIFQPISQISLSLSGFNSSNIEYLGILLTAPDESKYSLILGGYPESASTEGNLNVIITTSANTSWDGRSKGSYVNDPNAYTELPFNPPSPVDFNFGDKTDSIFLFRDLNPYDLNGTWSLYIQDFGSDETGYLSGASLDFSFGVPPSPTPTPTPTQTQKCFGKAVDVTGSTFNYPAATPPVTPTPSNLSKNCVVTGTTEFRTFQSVFSNNYNKLLTDCSNGSTYTIAQPLPFNTGSTFQATIDGKSVCVTYTTEVVNTAINVLNSIESGNLFQCRFCSITPTPTPTPSMTVTPTVTPTFTPTPSATPCTYYGIDYTFVVGKGFDGLITVRDIEQDSKNNYIVAGAFTDYNFHVISGIVRLTPNGVYDNTFLVISGFSGVSATNSGPQTIAIDTTDRVLCVGGFGKYSGITTNGLCRLNNNGTLDTDFLSNNGTGPNSSPLSVGIQSNNKIIIVGNFTSFDGNVCGKICRLNSDGSFDSSFNNGGSGFSILNPSEVKLLPDDSMIIIGAFITYNGTSANRIIKLTKDGDIDPSFVYGSGFNNIVNRILVASDGSVYVSGNFTTYNGTSVSDIVKLSSDGTLDTTFSSNVGSGFSGVQFALDIAEDQSGKILLCGNPSSTFNGNNFNGLIRLNTNGVVDNSLTLSEGFNLSVNSVMVDSYGKIIAGGSFTEFNQNTYSGLIRLFPCQE
jgi:uncharacterized delta-60 repeat protein